MPSFPKLDGAAGELITVAMASGARTRGPGASVDDEGPGQERMSGGVDAARGASSSSKRNGSVEGGSIFTDDGFFNFFMENFVKKFLFPLCLLPKASGDPISPSREVCTSWSIKFVPCSHMRRKFAHAALGKQGFHSLLLKSMQFHNVVSCNGRRSKGNRNFLALVHGLGKLPSP